MDVGLYQSTGLTHQDSDEEVAAAAKDWSAHIPAHIHSRLHLHSQSHPRRCSLILIPVPVLVA